MCQISEPGNSRHDRVRIFLKYGKIIEPTNISSYHAVCDYPPKKSGRRPDPTQGGLFGGIVFKHFPKDPLFGVFRNNCELNPPKYRPSAEMVEKQGG